MLKMNQVTTPVSHIIADIDAARWSDYCVVVTFPAGQTRTYYEEQTECQFIYENPNDSMMYTYHLLFETKSTSYASICRDNEPLLSLAVDESVVVDGLRFELHYNG